MPVDRPFDIASLDSVRLELAPRTAVEQMPDGVLLFGEKDQLLHRLDGSGALLAILLRREATPGELVAGLTEAGAPIADAAKWVSDFLLQLSRLGLLATSLDARGSSQGTSRQVALAGARFEVVFDTRELLESFGPAYSHLHGNGMADAIFRIAQVGDLVGISEDGAPAILCEPQLAAIRLKTMLIERLLRDTGEIAALHAACLVRDEGATLLLGSPGAGKTTMTLALLSQGFSYAADDVVLLRRDGTVIGVPLAPGLKLGSWNFAEGLEGLELDPAVHMRPDGQAVRFLRVPAEAVVSTTTPVTQVIDLRRADDADMRLEPLSSEEALGALMEDSRSRDGRCSVETMAALAGLVRGSGAFRLHYRDALDAAPFVGAQRRDG